MTVVLYKNHFYALLLLLALFTGCSDPTSIGADLLDEDAAQVEIIDTFSVEARTVTGDVVQTFSPFSALRGYMVNSLTDPIFGASKAVAHLQSRLEFRNPDFAGARADSLVLVLAYDTTGFYGDLDEPFTLEIQRLTQFINQNDTYFSDTTIAFDPQPLGNITFTPADLDTLTFLDYSQGTPQTVRDVVLRIPLDQRLANELISLDSSIYQSDTSFIRTFNGLRLHAPAATSSSVSFDLFDNRSGMYLYYSQDTLVRQFRYTFGNFSTKFITFEHDYSGTPIEPFLMSNEASNDTILFTQGMAGVNIALSFPGLEDLNNVILNKAELTIHSAVLEGDNPADFPPAEQLVFYALNDEGRLDAIDDVRLAAEDIPLRFGGVPEASATGDGVVYRFTLTTYLQDVIDGQRSGELFLSGFPRPERASRAVIQNPAQGPERIRLKLTLTSLQ